MGISGASEVPRLIWIGMLSTTDNFVVRTNEFLKSSSKSWAQTSFMLVRREFDVVLLSENTQLFAKITKNTFSGHTSSFFDFEKKKTDFCEKSKTDLGFEI